jgi:quercetin dioxygenase-like cupin family protein
LDTQLQPYARNREEAPARWHLGSLTTILADTDRTGGTFALVESYFPPGFETPYHIHRAEDEAYYVLEGEVTLVVDGQKIVANPGTFAFGPRDIAHGYRVTSMGPSRMLLFASPAGFDQFILEASVEAQVRALPIDPQPPTLEQLVVIAQKYHIDVLGPFPE